MSKRLAWNKIESVSAKVEDVSDRIWSYHEMAFIEYKSVSALCELLEEEGFTVKKGLADIDTAFSASYGSGRPYIGILGEYDALSGLNQDADITCKQSDEPGLPGQGCGHNLLGCGAAEAAIGVKEYLEKTGKSGTVIFFGCPGEEGGSGKAFMAKAGVFDDLDACVTWHPGDINYACNNTNLANVQAAYKFYGTPSHAGALPHMGRSALDAVELMNTGVQYLREHIIQEARIHYAITDSGGRSPNVVQAYAEVLYLIRAPKSSMLPELYERVNNIARGAALMTDTRVEIDFYKACSDVLMNRVISKRLWDNMNEVGLPDYTEEELSEAESFRETFDRYNNLETYAQKSPRQFRADILSHRDEAINRFIAPYDEAGIPGYGSTDVGDTSYVCPTAQIYGATWASGTPGHSWQVVAQGKSSYAKKGMHFAAKVMAGSVVDMFEDNSIIERAKAEMDAELNGAKYSTLIPDGCKPRTL